MLSKKKWSSTFYKILILSYSNSLKALKQKEENGQKDFSRDFFANLKLNKGKQKQKKKALSFS